MASIPRIMVVDSANRLGDIVRAGMAMLNRRYVMVEFPTATEALDEVFRTEIDLAVTAYILDDTMNGIEWAEKAIREQAGAPIIVAATENDPPPDPAKLKSSPFQFTKITAGEKFLRALRVGLDGEDVVAAEEGATTAQLDIGPVPDLNVDAARTVLINTIRDLGAVGGLISDRVGRIVVDEGATGYIDKAQITTLLGPTFAQGVRVAPQIGGNGWSLKYYEGDQYNLFALALGYHYFVLFLVDASEKRALGAVNLYGRQGANKIMDLLGDVAWSHMEPVAVAEPETVAEEEPTPDVAVASVAESKVEEKRTTTEMAASLFEPNLEPVADLDVDLLFSQQADEQQFDELFESDMEGELDLLDSDESVSFEEAQNMGLLGE